MRTLDVGNWVEARLPAEVLHLDAAAAGRVFEAVLVAQVGHLRDEAARGAYRAQDEAEPLLRRARAGLGGLLGLTGGCVAFSDGAGTAFSTALAAWPLGRGGRVGTVASEYGPNAFSLARTAAGRGWELVALPVDGLGRVTDVPAGLDLVTFPQVASQRGVVQPVGDVLATGVPLVLDVAQALGQTDVPAGCAAYTGTSRKWLCGPRGVGFLAVDPAWHEALQPPVQPLPGAEGATRLDVHESHVAGRVGLAVALSEWTPALLPVVHRLAATLRRSLAGTRWRVVEPVEERSGITTLLPPAGVDPVAVRAALVARGILVSAVPASRAADLSGPVLRVSTAAWVDPADLAALAGELADSRLGRAA